MIIEYDRSPNISAEQRIRSLADSVRRAFEEIESGEGITIDVSSIQGGRVDFDEFTGGETPPPIPIECGGTNATTVEEARQNLNFIGQNPIASADEDTPEKWVALGTGHAYIYGTGKLKNQPVGYGLLENIVTGATSFQTFTSWTTGSTRRKWTRAGQSTWSAWLMTLDENTGIQMELLWQNASPTSAFAAQTINLDLSEYDAVMVTSYTADSIKLRAVGFSEITPGASNGFVLSTVYGTNNKIYGLYRIMYVTTTRVQVGDAYTTTPSADAKSTSAQIPFQIYGIKGVQ